MHKNIRKKITILSLINVDFLTRFLYAYIYIFIKMYMQKLTHMDTLHFHVNILNFRFFNISVKEAFSLNFQVNMYFAYIEYINDKLASSPIKISVISDVSH